MFSVLGRPTEYTCSKLQQNDVIIWTVLSVKRHRHFKLLSPPHYQLLKLVIICPVSFSVFLMMEVNSLSFQIRCCKENYQRHVIKFAFYKKTTDTNMFLHTRVVCFLVNPQGFIFVFEVFIRDKVDSSFQTFAQS